MNVILLTIFIGLILVGFFVAFFLNQRRHDVYSSPERDSLLPLEDEDFTPEDRRLRSGSGESRPDPGVRR